ncbi:MAG: hypothetical protein ACXWNZ_14075 [Vulcanimicrobiaceae bacterium]
MNMAHVIPDSPNDARKELSQFFGLNGRRKCDGLIDRKAYNVAESYGVFIGLQAHFPRRQKPASFSADEVQSSRKGKAMTASAAGA